MVNKLKGNLMIGIGKDKEILQTKMDICKEPHDKSYSDSHKIVVLSQKYFWSRKSKLK